MEEKINKIQFLASTIVADDKTALAIAEEAGIPMPSSHLAIMVASLAPLDKPNNNGVALSAKASEKFLKTIHQAQVNFGHLGAWYVSGAVIKEWIDKSTKETKVAFTFYKELYPQEFANALVAQYNGNLSVSFELLSNNASAEELSNGTLMLHDFEYTGVGLLGVIDNKKPAYSKGQVHQFAQDLKTRVSNYSNKELICAEQIVAECDKVLADYPTDTTMISDPPMTEPYDATLYIVTTAEDGHFHIAETDIQGNGYTIAVHGKDEEYHSHEIMDFQIQEAEGHVHKIMNEFMAELKEHIAKKKRKTKKKKWHYHMEESENNNTKAEEIVMNEEQKKKVADLRAELANYIPADTKDEVLLDEAKVAEFRTAKTAAEEKAKVVEPVVEKKEACGADLIRIQELEARVNELTKALDAKKAEFEAMKTENDAYKAAEEKKLAEEKAQAEADKKAKVDAAKAELKDNEFADKFSDEDYLDSEKVAVAKDRKELATIKANGGKVTAEIKPELPTGTIEVVQTSNVTKLLNKMLK